MRRLLLVANPAASGFTASLHRDVVEILGRSYDVTPIWPNGPAQARTDAAEAAAAGYEVVVAMGGDGVVHQVANAVIGTGAALGIVPAGTTNVFRRVVGLPRRPRDAAEVIAGATGTRRVQALAVTEHDGTGHPQTHVATFAAGVGFDAEVIRESERRPLKKVGFGALHYARSVVKVTLSDFRGRRPTLRVTGPGGTIDAVAVQFQVQDEFTYMSRLPLRLGSGPKPIATVLHKITPFRMVHAVGRAATRSGVDRVRGIEMWEGFDRVEIEADPLAWVEADGEMLGQSASIVAEPDPRNLLVVTG
jgi:diacylglycerol kinase family enzyme